MFGSLTSSPTARIAILAISTCIAIALVLGLVFIQAKHDLADKLQQQDAKSLGAFALSLRGAADAAKLDAAGDKVCALPITAGLSLHHDDAKAAPEIFFQSPSPAMPGASPRCTRKIVPLEGATGSPPDRLRDMAIVGSDGRVGIVLRGDVSWPVVFPVPNRSWQVRTPAASGSAVGGRRADAELPTLNVDGKRKIVLQQPLDLHSEFAVIGDSAASTFACKPRECRIVVLSDAPTDAAAILSLPPFAKAGFAFAVVLLLLLLPVIKLASIDPRGSLNLFDVIAAIGVVPLVIAILISISTTIVLWSDMRREYDDRTWALAQQTIDMIETTGCVTLALPQSERRCNPIRHGELIPPSFSYAIIQADDQIVVYADSGSGARYDFSLDENKVVSQRAAVLKKGIKARFPLFDAVYAGKPVRMAIGAASSSGGDSELYLVTAWYDPHEAEELAILPIYVVVPMMLVIGAMMFVALASAAIVDRRRLLRFLWIDPDPLVSEPTRRWTEWVVRLHVILAIALILGLFIVRGDALLLHGILGPFLLVILFTRPFEDAGRTAPCKAPLLTFGRLVAFSAAAGFTLVGLTAAMLTICRGDWLRGGIYLLLLAVLSWIATAGWRIHSGSLDPQAFPRTLAEVLLPWRKGQAGRGAGQHHGPDAAASPQPATAPSITSRLLRVLCMEAAAMAFLAVVPALAAQSAGSGMIRTELTAPKTSEPFGALDPYYATASMIRIFRPEPGGLLEHAATPAAVTLLSDRPARMGAIVREIVLLAVAVLAVCAAAVYLLRLISLNLFGLQHFAFRVLHPPHSPSKIRSMSVGSLKAVFIDFPNRQFLDFQRELQSSGGCEVFDLGIERKRLGEKSMALLTAKSWVIVGFESIIANRELRLNALGLLEQLAARPEANIYFFAQTLPLVRLRQAREREKLEAKAAGVTPDVVESESFRWAELFSDFISYTWDEQLPLRAKPAPALNNLRRLLQAVPQRSTRHDVWRWARDNREVAKAIADEMICVPSDKIQEQIRSFGLSLAQKRALDEAKARRRTKHMPPPLFIEQVHEYMANFLGDYYQGQWVRCSKEEHLVLYHLAHGRFVNTSNFAVLNSLLARRLVKTDPNFQLMNNSFGHWIRTLEHPDWFEQYRLDTEKAGTWTLLRLPLILLIAAGSIFAAYLDQDSSGSLFTLLPGVFATMPVLLARFQRNTVATT